MFGARKGPSGRNSPASPSDAQAREKLAIYVYEYLVHAGAKSAADAFKRESNLADQNITPGEAPGFLHSWWCVFWDLYCAAPERRDNCEHSNDAKVFHDYGMNSGMPLVNGMQNAAPSPMCMPPGQSEPMGGAGPMGVPNGPHPSFYPGGGGRPPVPASQASPISHNPPRFGGAGRGAGGGPMVSTRDGGMPPFSGPPGVMTTGGMPLGYEPMRPGMLHPGPGFAPGTPTGSGGPQRLPASTGAPHSRMPIPNQPCPSGIPNNFGPGGPMRPTMGVPRPGPWPPGSSSGMPAMSMANGPSSGTPPIMASPQNMPAGFVPDRYGNMMPQSFMPGGGPGGDVPPNASVPGGPTGPGGGPGGGDGGPGGAGGPGGVSMNGAPGTPSSAVHTPTTTTGGGGGQTPSAGPGAGGQQASNQIDIKSSPSSSHGNGGLNGSTPGPAIGPGSAGGGTGATGAQGTPTPSTPQPTSSNTPTSTAANGPPSVPAGSTAVTAGGAGGRSSVPPKTENSAPESMDFTSGTGFPGDSFQERNEIAKIKASMMEESKQFESKSDSDSADNYFQQI